MLDQGRKRMEKKNVMFTRDGMKVGVKEVKEEEYQDRTQRQVPFWLKIGRARMFWTYYVH